VGEFYEFIDSAVVEDDNAGPCPNRCGSAPDADRQVRDGAWVAELTGLLDLSSWPKGMRVIVGKDARIPALSCGSPTWTGTGSPNESYRVTPVTGADSGP
jgi:hypothetical protein